VVTYVKVVKEYDDCFNVGCYYKLVRDYETHVALYSYSGRVFCIPKNCVE